MDTMNWEALYEQYHHALFEDFLPFSDRFLVDPESGGFLCNTDRDGTRLSTNRDIWFDGRGLWVYSHLYREFGRHQAHLDVAARTAESLLRLPRDGERWPRRYTRDLQPLAWDDEVYGALFVAEGLAEYGAACGDGAYRKKAIQILLECDARAHRSDYQGNATAYYPGAPAVPPGTRVQGVSMVLLRLVTQWLRDGADGALEQVANRCVHALTELHRDTETQLNLEFLTPEGKPLDGPHRWFVYTGHGVEAAWMLIDEAHRRRDDALLRKVTAQFHRHLEVGWDWVYGGLFRGAPDIQAHRWLLDKVLWAQEEILIGTLMTDELTGEAWATEWFDRTYSYVMEHFPLAPHGLPLWITSADRRVTFEPHTTRIENYHHPRHLLLNLEILRKRA